MSGTKPEFEGLETVGATRKSDTSENEEINTKEMRITELNAEANVNVPIVVASPREHPEEKAKVTIRVETAMNTYAKTKRIANAKNGSAEAQLVSIQKTGRGRKLLDHATSYNLTSKELKDNEVAFVINEPREIIQPSVANREFIEVQPTPPKKRFLRAVSFVFLCLVVGVTALMNSNILVALSLGRMQLEASLGLTNCGWSAVYRNHLHQLGHPRLA